jgi:hypothetical protein
VLAFDRFDAASGYAVVANVIEGGDQTALAIIDPRGDVVHRYNQVGHEGHEGTTTRRNTDPPRCFTEDGR